MDKVKKQKQIKKENKENEENEENDEKKENKENEQNEDNEDNEVNIENKYKKEKRRLYNKIISLRTESSNCNENDENNLNIDEFKKKKGEIDNIFKLFSKHTKKFFRVFMWKIINLCSEKKLKNINKENLYEMFLTEVKKEKLQEIRGKSRKIIIEVPDGRDLLVNIKSY
jgi:hypothetical protein